MSMEWTDQWIQGIADPVNLFFCLKQGKKQEIKQVLFAAHLMFSLCPVSFFHANV